MILGRERKFVLIIIFLLICHIINDHCPWSELRDFAWQRSSLRSAITKWQLQMNFDWHKSYQIKVIYVFFNFNCRCSADWTRGKIKQLMWHSLVQKWSLISNKLNMCKSHSSCKKREAINILLLCALSVLLKWHFLNPISSRSPHQGLSIDWHENFMPCVSVYWIKGRLSK